MRDFKWEFSSSNDSYKRRKIDDESQRKSQIDVFIVTILLLKIAFSLNYFSAFLILVFVFVAAAFSLKISMWEENASEFISTCVFITCVFLTYVLVIYTILTYVFSTCVSSMSCNKRLEIIIENSRMKKKDENEF
jgi:predicted membrane protein